jgi:outer membrane biosynthesis protein TonB
MEEQSREVETQPPLLDGELHLLIGELKDEASGYRRREAAWISIVVHGLIVVALIFMPKWLPESALIVPAHEKDTPLVLIGDKSPNVIPPKTNVLSDQNRIAETRTPTVKAPAPRFLDPGRPGPPKPASPPPEPAGAQMQALPGPPQGGQPMPPPPPTQSAQLQAPLPRQNPFAIPSAGSAVDNAIRSAANNRPTSTRETFGGGEGGAGIHARTDHRGAIEVLSDTRGVDFGPYLKRMKYVVLKHWDPLVPEVARPPIMKRGMLIIDFYIMKDGSIRGMTLIKPSGDLALDDAAWGALTSSIPLERLPVEFSGDYLHLRAAFYYNPDTKEFE